MSKLGPKAHYFGIFRLEFEETIVKFEIKSFKFA